MKKGYGFWLQWVIVTLVGFLVSLYWIEIGEKPDIRAGEGVIGGLIIGVAQWFVLRKRVSQAGWWIVASFLSWGLIAGIGFGAWGWAVPRNSLEIPQRLIFGILSGVQVGALIGVGQWLVLRKQIPKARLYIFVSSLSWAVGLVISWISGAFLRSRTGLFLGEVMGLTLGWVVVAAITGIVLTRLLRGAIQKPIVS